MEIVSLTSIDFNCTFPAIKLLPVEEKCFTLLSRESQLKETNCEGVE